MLTINPRGYFISGADTDVGKTYVGCQILQQLIGLGCKVEARKPAESGCQRDADNKLLPADSLAWQRAGGMRQSLDDICRYRFADALAPHRAARLAGQSLHISDLLEACSSENADSIMLVEGAGGFLSPLAENGLNADLASALQLPVICVVEDRVGAVNQSLLTIEAVEARQLSVAAIILNRIHDDHAAGMNNVEDLRSHCRHPIFTLRRNQQLEPVFADPRMEKTP